jgi:hypothetical protein
MNCVLSTIRGSRVHQRISEGELPYIYDRKEIHLCMVSYYVFVCR